MAQSSNSTSLLALPNTELIANARVAIVRTEWNEQIVAAQVAGADRIFNQVGVKSKVHYTVPGAFEIPFACKQIAEQTLAQAHSLEAIIVFGAVIRGGTPHFEYVCQALVHGLSELNISLPIPIIFGVLTLNTEAEAWERLGGIHGHKGEEAAITALKMIHFNRALAQ